jgi:hypothetical protein
MSPGFMACPAGLRRELAVGRVVCASTRRRPAPITGWISYGPRRVPAVTGYANLYPYKDQEVDRTQGPNDPPVTPPPFVKDAERILLIPPPVAFARLRCIIRRPVNAPFHGRAAATRVG